MKSKISQTGTPELLSQMMLISKEACKEALVEFESQKSKNEIIIYSKHFVAKLLKSSDRTINKLIKNKMIKTTKDGRILKTELENYLNNI